MKRELDFGLPDQSQLAQELEVQNGEFSGVPEDRIGKRLKGEIGGCEERKGWRSMSSGILVYRRTRRFKNAKVEDKPICSLGSSVCEGEKKAEAELRAASSETELRDGGKSSNSGGSGGGGMAVDVPVEATKLRELGCASEEDLVECIVSVAVGSELLDSNNNEAVLCVEVDESSEASALETQTKKKLEIKMSKKIALGRIPKTVKELFATGLLEGYSVFYNGGSKGYALRGMIKGKGILCFCSSCNGSKVVNPCQFEIHACKSYRRAAQYICLENGKSLLQVVKACSNSPLDTLDETIQSAIGSLPENESIICQNCNGSFLATFAEKVKKLCKSCSVTLQPEATPTDADTRSLEPDLALRKSMRTAKTCTSAEDGSQEKIRNNRSSDTALISESPGSGSICVLSPKKSQQKIIVNSTVSKSALKFSSRASVRIPSRNDGRGKIIKKYSKPVLARKLQGCASVRILSKNKSHQKITKMSSKADLIPRSSESGAPCISPPKKTQWKITKKDLRLHKLVFEEGGLPDGTEVAYFSHGQKLRDGFKRGQGIFCHCCSCEVSPSQFEAHAGWASRRKPYSYIFTSNGVSLHEFAISLLKGRKCSAKDNDDLCIICADGGNLLLCDGCPRAFHIECASLSSIPRGKWYCNYCQNMFQREKFERNANAVAAGRVSGVDPIEQITKRCIRIVKNPEDADLIACVLCRGYDFSKSGFGPRTVIVCDQCEREYHVGCLKKNKMADLKELPKGKWFCCMDCRKIFSTLQNLLNHGEEKIPDSLLDLIRKRHEGDISDSVVDFDVRWRLLNGKIASPETRSLLSKAVAIFHECFDPIVDSATGRDFIPTMVYGRNIRGQDFGGMYCAVLTVNSSVVSAGIFRVFGQEIAELPLVATSTGNQRKGYFQILFSCIERFFASLKVRNLVLPAADEAESIWTQKFGFEKIPPEQLSDYRKICWQMLTFKGTTMLQKLVPQG
ncbi:uncharacterized protein LOC127790163 [Diospyros lotus]|uniref:uncharacterized protein LOC127790163 n=1 Tax=Diospyros lotus TaxID=55363 RepID=UPI00225B7024|nr:uncharacterized protein LOC127790163 [Diospyros lotus]